MPEKALHIDIETRSDIDLSKAGVYPYSESPKAKFLLVAAAVDDGEIQCFDLTSGETLPEWFLAALTDPGYIKVAHNASFERVWFSRYLYGSTSSRFLDPAQWHAQ
jgi:DNA polymerase